MITIENHSPVHIVRMNFGRANAINLALLDHLESALERERAGQCRGVVLTGYDRFFSAGLHLADLYSLGRPRMQEFIERFTDVFLKVFAFPKPIVAAINGHAVAGGCILALACDYRVAADGEFKIGLNEIALGITFPAVALEIAKYSLSGASFADLFLQARMCSPMEALRAKLADEIAEPGEILPAALSVCERMASQPADAFARIKGDLRRATIRTVEAERESSNAAFVETWFSPETRRRIEALLAAMGRKKKTPDKKNDAHRSGKPGR